MQLRHVYVRFSARCSGLTRSIAVRFATLSLLAGALIATSVVAAEPAMADASLCSGSGYSSCVSAGYTDHGYGANSGNSYWHMYSGHNCTNYVAYVEQIVNGAPAPSIQLGIAWQ